MEKINISDVKSGWIGLCSADSFLANTIQDFQEMEDKTAGKFNHAFKFFRDVNNDLMVSEANATGIVARDFVNEYMNDDKYKIVLALEPIFQYDSKTDYELQQSFWSRVKKSYYNFIHLLGYALRYVSSGYIDLLPKEGNGVGFCCAEWAAFTFIKYFPQYQEITPESLYLSPLFKKYIIKNI